MFLHGAPHLARHGLAGDRLAARVRAATDERRRFGRAGEPLVDRLHDEALGRQVEHRLARACARAVVEVAALLLASMEIDAPVAGGTCVDRTFVRVGRGDEPAARLAGDGDPEAEHAEE
jgi:hypothetical protein